MEDEESMEGGHSSSSSSVRRSASTRRPGSATRITGKEGSGAGALGEDDFTRAFAEVPCLQIYSSRELDDSMNKIRELLSDDKQDWEQRVAALKKVRSLLLAGASDHESFSVHLRQLERPLKLSTKDLRSQVVREACITLGHLSSVLGSRFDHAAESVMPVLLALLPNSAKVMATSGAAAIRIIIRHTHCPRLIPIMTSYCSSKSVAVRRRCYEFLDLLLQDWQTSSLERHVPNMMDTIKRGVHDADSEARSLARKCYWGFHAHFRTEAELVFHELEANYQKALQSHLPPSERSSISVLDRLPRSASTKSGRSLKRGAVSSSRSVSLHRSRSDVDVIAVAGVKTRLSKTPSFSSATALPPGSYASLGRVRTRQRGGASVTDSRGRSRAKSTSQSQPGSRSASPGKLPPQTSNRKPGGPADRCVRIPRSHGCSREASPSSVTEDGFGLVHQAMQILYTGEMEAGTDSLYFEDSRNKWRACRQRFESPVMFSDEDTNSDASSCSERSFSSRGGATAHRQAEGVAEVLNRCGSSISSERRDGLQQLQNLLRSHGTFSRVELKRLCEIFTRMFADPHSKVFSVFLETLVVFIMLHHAELHDWLFVLLMQLIKKMGADLLGSVQAKVQRALDVTRDSFPHEQQFNILMRFIVDQTQTPNLKVKVAILRYTESLSRQMDPSDLMNSSETRLAVSRIITWTAEPRSADVRKAARLVLIALFELNTPEVSMLLAALPKTFQDGATKLLHQHLKTTSAPLQVSPSGRDPAGRAAPPPSPSSSPRLGPPPRRSAGMLERDTENVNAEQSFSSRAHTDPVQPIRRENRREEMVAVTSSAVGVVMEGGRVALDNKTSILNTPWPVCVEKAALGPCEEGPLHQAGKNKLRHLRGVVPGSSQHQEGMGDLLKELSNHSARAEERRGQLLELLQVVGGDGLVWWEEHFKSVLLLLLETLGDQDQSVRVLALRVLKEVMCSQPSRFRNYAELTIMKTLEAHKDPHKEVVRAAEETASTLASSIQPEQCSRVLSPIIQTAAFPINLAAIKMETRVIQRLSQDALLQLLPDIMPGLLQGYDNAESSVRKACVFCLVAVYSVIGDQLKPHLQHLSSSKMKLLNLYIRRAQTSSPDISSHC